MLRYARVRLRCRWEDPGKRIRSPLHWRDDLERAMQGIACILRRQRCEECIVRARCTYAGLFLGHGAPSEKGSEKYPWLHPFSFVFPAPGGDEERFQVEVTLVGKWVERLPYWLLALERMGRGRGHPFHVEEGEEWAEGQWITFYDGEARALLRAVEQRAPFPLVLGERVELRWIRPGRLLREGRPAIPLDFEKMFVAVHRRVQGLWRWYGEGDVSWDGRRLLRAARDVRLTPLGLRWEEHHLYSRRQKQSVAVGGLMGGMLLEGPLAPFGELLAMGRDLGVGKGTALGLGRYELCEP